MHHCIEPCTQATKRQHLAVRADPAAATKQPASKGKAQ